MGIVGHLFLRPELIVEFRIEVVEKPGAGATCLFLPEAAGLSFHINEKYFEESADDFQPKAIARPELPGDTGQQTLKGLVAHIHQIHLYPFQVGADLFEKRSSGTLYGQMEKID